MSDYKMIMNIKTPLIILGTTSARDQLKWVWKLKLPLPTSWESSEARLECALHCIGFVIIASTNLRTIGLYHCWYKNSKM